MAGKVCLVTRATSGIESEAGNKAVRYLLADFPDLDQVRELEGAEKANLGP